MKPLGKSQKTNYIDLLYMIPAVINAREITTFLGETQHLNVDFWEAVDVLEVTLPNNNTLDFEPMDPDFKDPSDASFVRNRNIQTIYGIHMNEDDLTTMIPHFEAMVAHFTGFICADTEDFKPVYVGTTALS